MATPPQSTKSDRKRRALTLSKNQSRAYTPRQASGFAIIEQARQGVPTHKVDQLAQLLSITFKELATLLQVAERTLHRFRREGQLDKQASERLLLLENLAAHGLLVFDGQAEVLADWLRYPLRELKGQAPLQLLATISGFSLVDDVLTRIEYGVYS
jgi:putative toxin-antitoxin system antitoxin component (TIGR02293 family)